jgi:hypothetical protein
MPFQTSVNQFLAPGLPGGWAGSNPYVSLVPPNTGDLTATNAASWRVGATGAILGNFAFADSATGLVTAGHPGTVGPIRIGFVQRDQMALITNRLGRHGHQHERPADADRYRRHRSGCGLAALGHGCSGWRVRRQRERQRGDHVGQLHGGRHLRDRDDGVPDRIPRCEPRGGWRNRQNFGLGVIDNA